jgi:hypothetical protein
MGITFINIKLQLFVLLINYFCFSCIYCLVSNRENEIRYSSAFHSQLLDFDCSSILCGSYELYDSYFHIVVGTSHPSAFPLLVHRICEARQKCIKTENMIIILHATISSRIEPKKTLSEIEEWKLKCENSGEEAYPFEIFTLFLKELNISYIEWIDNSFTANSKMMSSFRALRERRIIKAEQLIYQTDIDEIPQYEQFNAAMSELAEGTCNAIKGEWRDRVDSEGRLRLPSIPRGCSRDEHASLSLASQFPLRCRFSELFVGGGKTTKTIVYRANYRLDGGNHEIWCDRAVKNFTRVVHDHRVNKTIVRQAAPSEERHLACIEHIRDRNKGSLGREILQQLPNHNVRPIYCNTVVTLDHYKFTHGLVNYLQRRYEVYKNKKLHWWKDSYRVLEHLKNHNVRNVIY